MRSQPIRHWRFETTPSTLAGFARKGWVRLHERLKKMNHLFVIAGEKRQRFFRHIRTTYALPIHQLIRVAKSREQYSPPMRAAALRNLVASAPVEVTLGRAFNDRRRLVRAHYGI